MFCILAEIADKVPTITEAWVLLIGLSFPFAVMALTHRWAAVAAAFFAGGFLFYLLGPHIRRLFLMIRSAQRYGLSSVVCGLLIRLWRVSLPL